MNNWTRVTQRNIAHDRLMYMAAELATARARVAELEARLEGLRKTKKDGGE